MQWHFRIHNLSAQ